MHRSLFVIPLMLALLAAGIAHSEELIRPNVVLIVVDALRPDHLGYYGYQRPTSPSIDILAGRSVVFETAITQAPWTKGSFSSIFTSLYPFQHWVTDWESVMPETLVTLPEILQRNGYSTMCVMNMTGLSGRFGVLAGFEEVVEPEKIYWDAEETTDIAIRLMQRELQPFFMVVHYFDTHDPYRPPRPFLEEIKLPSEPNPLDSPGGGHKKISGVPSDEHVLRETLLYDGCIRYVDEHIGRLISELAQARMTQSTLLIVTADHGEAFWEHGVSSHGANVYDEAILVPLILSYPDGFAGGKRIRDQVSHVDILPTILDLLGIQDDEHREGTSLLSLIEDGTRSRGGDTFLPRGSTLCECTVRRAPGTKCIRNKDWKLIVEPTTSVVELYNLREDPGETVNRWGVEMERTRAMMMKLQEIPGVRLQGWRCAFTGGGRQARFVADVDLPEGGRFTSVQRFTRGPTLAITVAEDSASLHIESEPEDLDLLLFEIIPADTPVRFHIESSGDAAPPYANVGDSANVPLGDTFTLRPSDAIGLPGDFEAARRTKAAGVHLWWLSGEEMAQQGRTTELTPEEIKRLKALGYIQ